MKFVLNTSEACQPKPFLVFLAVFSVLNWLVGLSEIEKSSSYGTTKTDGSASGKTSEGDEVKPVRNGETVAADS